MIPTKSLWAPWRTKYVKLKKVRGCLFCKATKSKSDKKNYILYRSRHCFSMLNIYPYNNGHIMVAPYRHIKYLNSLTQKEIVDIFTHLKKICSDVDKVLKPQGYNIGINLGRIAGAGINKHIHIHIVPRWQGDTNFMPVVCGTKVIPQGLNELYRTLKRPFEKSQKNK